jgi:hypothetical protein
MVGERKSPASRDCLARTPALHRTHALDILGFKPFIAGYDIEGNFVSFIQGFEPRTRDGRVMHENVLSCILGDEAKPFFIVEPLDFATGHNELLTFDFSRPAPKRKKDTTENSAVPKSLFHFSKTLMPQFMRPS